MPAETNRQECHRITKELDLVAGLLPLAGEASLLIRALERERDRALLEIDSALTEEKRAWAVVDDAKDGLSVVFNQEWDKLEKRIASLEAALAGDLELARAAQKEGKR